MTGCCLCKNYKADLRHISVFALGIGHRPVVRADASVSGLAAQPTMGHTHGLDTSGLEGIVRGDRLWVGYMARHENRDETEVVPV